MQIGDVALGGRFALATGAMPVGSVVAAAVEAEAAGAEAVFLGEGITEVDAVVATGAVLAATRRVAAGPGLANVHDRHPAALARAVAALDRLHPGRIHLGIGRGDREAVETGLGLPWSGGLAALEDTLTIVRGLLAGGPVHHDGRRWSAHLDAVPARSRARGPVPVYLGATGPRGLRLAGARADGVLLNYGAPPEYVGWAVAEVAAGARAAGRDPAGVDVHAWLLVARTDRPGGAAQLERVRTMTRWILDRPGEGALLAGPAGGVPAVLDDAALARFALVGDLPTLRDRLREYRDAGVRCPVLLPSGMRAFTEVSGDPDDL